MPHTQVHPSFPSLCSSVCGPHIEAEPAACPLPPEGTPGQQEPQVTSEKDLSIHKAGPHLALMALSGGQNRRLRSCRQLPPPKVAELGSAELGSFPDATVLWLGRGGGEC